MFIVAAISDEQSNYFYHKYISAILQINDIQNHKRCTLKQLQDENL